MSNIERYLFDLATGAIGARYNCPMDQIEVNTPQGCDTIDATLVIDPESQRVNLDTREVEDFQPAPPDADHEWIHDDEQGNRVRRWRLKPEAAERQARRAAAIARIDVLAGKTERAVREHLLGIEPTEADRAAGAMTLREIQDEIAVLRLEV